ncbi:hypothetical protein Tco_0783251 [Tanacetum coccineum]
MQLIEIIKGDEGEIEWDVRRRSKNSLFSLCKSENETLANVRWRYPSPSSFRYHHRHRTAIAPPSSLASRHRDHRRHAFTVTVVTFTIVTPSPSQSPSLSMIQRHQEVASDRPLLDLQVSVTSGVHFDLVKRKQVKEVNIDGDIQDGKRDNLIKYAIYMVQLLNLIVPNVGAPALHKSVLHSSLRNTPSSDATERMVQAQVKAQLETKAQMEWFKKLELLLGRELPPLPNHQAG